MTDLDFYLDAARSSLPRSATAHQILERATELAKKDRLERLVESGHKLVPLAKRIASLATDLAKPIDAIRFAAQLGELRSTAEQLQDGCSIVLATSLEFPELERAADQYQGEEPEKAGKAGKVPL